MCVCVSVRNATSYLHESKPNLFRGVRGDHRKTIPNHESRPSRGGADRGIATAGAERAAVPRAPQILGLRSVGEVLQCIYNTVLRKALLRVPGTRVVYSRSVKQVVRNGVCSRQIVGWGCGFCVW